MTGNFSVRVMQELFNRCAFMLLFIFRTAYRRPAIATMKNPARIVCNNGKEGR